MVYVLNCFCYAPTILCVRNNRTWITTVNTVESVSEGVRRRPARACFDRVLGLIYFRQLDMLGESGYSRVYQSRAKLVSYT